MEDFKRPNHNDFLTSSELKAKRYNGIRFNSVTSDLECWIDGNVVFFSTQQELAIDHKDFDKKYGEHFGFTITEREGN